jgi:hypothetical protein
MGTICKISFKKWGINYGRLRADKIQRCGTTIQKVRFLAIGALFLVIACATWSSYPIFLHIAPDKEYPQVSPELRGKMITITTFEDNRGVSDPRVIGKRIDYEGREIPFISSRGYPSINVAKALQTYLFKKGYTISGKNPNWDLDLQTISTEWGEWVIGGSIEDLSLEVKSYVRTFYDCRLKLRVVVADAKEKNYRYRETVELSSSYKGAVFRLENCERMINKILEDAIEKALDGLNKE